jgi:LAGLIDADG-like domain
VEITCPGCGKVYERPAWEVRKGLRYCEPACYNRHRTGKKRGPYKGHEPEERTCEVCGKVFLVGGVGRPPRSQRRCSDACRIAGRYRHGRKAKALTATDAAYLAGIIDGEGSVILYMRRDVVALRVTVANTSRPLLERIQAATGIGDVHQQRAESATHRASFSWRCNAEAAESLLAQLRPFLFLKTAQADLAFATQARLRDPAQKADRSWHLLACEQMRALNRRGPAS